MTVPAQKPRTSDVPSAAACAEAAAWIARLHGEDRSAKIEAGFQRWLAANPENRAAFEMANDIWVGTEQLPKPPVPAFVRWPRAGVVLTWPRALATVAVLTTVAVGVALFPRDPGLTTRVGEQRNLNLQDGTRVSLNTASRIHVHYTPAARRVELDEGEAYFEVAKRSDWPFVVVAGGRQVVARGTAFVVRRDEEKVSVTLVEGKVTVAPAGESVSLPSTSPVPAAKNLSGVRPREPQSGSAEITLTPGQRLTFVDHEAPQVDQPALERVTAWQRGQVILDHTPLADAVAEMNRYSDVELKIEEAEAGRAEVTGIFRVGDSENFARAVAESYHLRVSEHQGQIVLSGLPSGTGGDVKEK
jgi:transmembrane sensor